MAGFQTSTLQVRTGFIENAYPDGASAIDRSPPFSDFTDRLEWEHPATPRADLAATAAAWRVIAARTRHGGATVAYAGNNLPYPLTGAGFRNRVLFVPRNRHRDAAYYNRTTPARDVLIGGTRAQWLANVAALHVEYLCVFRRSAANDHLERFPVEARWADATPGRFHPVHTTPWTRIYRVTAP